MKFRTIIKKGKFEWTSSNYFNFHTVRMEDGEYTVDGDWKDFSGDEKDIQWKTKIKK